MGKLKKYTISLFVIMVSLSVVSCSDKPKSYIGGKTWPKELCINGVVYYTFGHGKAPAYKIDGSLYACDV